MNRIEIERLRKMIRTAYMQDEDCSNYERLLMDDFENGCIGEDEFEHALVVYYCKIRDKQKDNLIDNQDYNLN